MSQLFTDMAHIAYSGYVPKKELDRIAGKPSWEDFGHTEQELGNKPVKGLPVDSEGPESIEELEQEQYNRLLYIRDMYPSTSKK